MPAHAARTCLPRPRPNRMHPGRSSMADGPGRHDAHVLAAPMSLSPRRRVPALLERVARCVADLDGYVAACVHPTSATIRSVPRTGLDLKS
eukprot:5482912-Prymnesium_polylepis.1